MNHKTASHQHIQLKDDPAEKQPEAPTSGIKGKLQDIVMNIILLETRSYFNTRNRKTILE